MLELLAGAFIWAMHSSKSRDGSCSEPVMTERHKIVALTAAQTLLLPGFWGCFFKVSVVLWWRVQKQLSNFLSITSSLHKNAALASWFLFFLFFSSHFWKQNLKKSHRVSTNHSFVAVNAPHPRLLSLSRSDNKHASPAGSQCSGEFILIPTKAGAGGEKSL